MTPRELYLEWLLARDKLDHLGARTPELERAVFRSCSLPAPDFEIPELAFFKIVSQLYVHYFELGRPAIAYCIDLATKQGWAGEQSAICHWARVRRLRTYLQHQLNAESDGDSRTIGEVEDWYYSCCHSRYPRTSDDYLILLSSLISEGIAFLNTLIDVLTKLERDPDFAISARQLRSCIDRFHPPSDFDQVIEIVKQDLGRDFDTVAFRNRNYEKWKNFLALSGPGYSFEIESRRLVEDSILSDIPLLLPINGMDVMKELGIPPGPCVASVLSRARKLYQEDPKITADSLLKRISEWWAASLSPGPSPPPATVVERNEVEDESTSGSVLARRQQLEAAPAG